MARSRGLCYVCGTGQDACPHIQPHCPQMCLPGSASLSTCVFVAGSQAHQVPRQLPPQDTGAPVGRAPLLSELTDFPPASDGRPSAPRPVLPHAGQGEVTGACEAQATTSREHQGHWGQMDPALRGDTTQGGTKTSESAVEIGSWPSERGAPGLGQGTGTHGLRGLAGCGLSC